MTKPQPAPYGPDPVDVAVGATLRLRRRTRGISQATLAEAAGVTFQQIQKYERGANRVSASMLARLSVALGCSVGDLFAGLPGGDALSDGDPDGFGRVGRKFLSEDDGIELARLFLILTPAHRKAVLAVARALGLAQ